DTHQLDWFEQSSQYQGYSGQYELAKIAAISADGLTITLTSPLQFNHLGSRDVNGNVEFLPHVGVLSRNVAVRSENPAGVRGYALFTQQANVDIRYVDFLGLGRTKVGPIDNTARTADGATHLGTNQGGRYAVTFSHLFGPGMPQADGYQYTFLGNTVDDPL